MKMIRDYKKFFTYPETAKFMVSLLAPKDNEWILEPSAGDGALVKAVKEYNKNTCVFAVEINKEHEGALWHLADGYEIYDFLLSFHDDDYDGCVANPPFGNGIDLQAHFDKICSLVKYGGKIVMIVPEDFEPNVPHKKHPLENWSKNSDGTTTPIKIIEFKNRL